MFAWLRLMYPWQHAIVGADFESGRVRMTALPRPRPEHPVLAHARWRRSTPNVATALQLDWASGPLRRQTALRWDRIRPQVLKLPNPGPHDDRVNGDLEVSKMTTSIALN